VPRKIAHKFAITWLP